MGSEVFWVLGVFLKYMHIHNEVLWGVRPKSDFMVYVSKPLY